LWLAAFCFKSILFSQFHQSTFLQPWLLASAYYGRNRWLSILLPRGCFPGRNVSKCLQVISLAIVMDPVSWMLSVLQLPAFPKRHFQSLRLLFAVCFSTQPFEERQAPFFGYLNILEIILFVQIPALPWCSSEEPFGLVQRSTKSISPFPPLQGYLLWLT
jgi:hypothetical protein